MLYRKVTEPWVVTLLAIINVSEKEGLSWKFYLHKKGWKCYCCYFICTQSGKSLEKEMSIIWYSFKVASLFLGGSTDYLQEAWVIPRQVGGRIRLFPAETAGSRFFLSPPQRSWRDTCNQAWLTRYAIQEKWPSHADIQSLFPTVTLELWAQGLQQPVLEATEPTPVTVGDLETQGLFMTASLVMWSFWLHLCLLQFYEPGALAFLVILWTGPITTPTKILPIKSFLL